MLPVPPTFCHGFIFIFTFSIFHRIFPTFVSSVLFLNTHLDAIESYGHTAKQPYIHRAIKLYSHTAIQPKENTEIYASKFKTLGILWSNYRSMYEHINRTTWIPDQHSIFSKCKPNPKYFAGQLLKCGKTNVSLIFALSVHFAECTLYRQQLS